MNDKNTGNTMRHQYDSYPELKGASDEEKVRAYCSKYRERYPDRALYRAAKSRAKKRGIEFTISFSDVVVPEKCPILGITLSHYSGTGLRGGRMDSPSLDRIDNTKGYIPGNVQVISHQANSMKFTASPEELLRFADWIKETYNGRT